MAGPEELHGYLLNRRDEFLRTVVEKLMAYALGRSLEYFDAPAVRKILRDSSNENYRWSSIIDGVVKSEPFRMRRVSDETDPQQRTLLDALRAANDRHAKTRPFDRDLSARLESFELAYRMQVAAPEAFDIGLETKQTQEAYGLNRQESKDYGRQCLIARRLIERGVRFVQVFADVAKTPGGGVNDVPWDAHSDISVNHGMCARSVDQPTGALLDDLKQRGLLDDTLVIYGGEFGRTSDSQGAKGRDHNPNAFTTWMAGGGVKGGTQYGATDTFGYKSVDKRVSAHDLHATILKLMGFDHEKLTYRFNGRDFRLTDVAGDVIDALIA